MADGSTKPIEDVELGDLVWAADPESGEEGPREVTRLITGHGDKTLVDIEVDGDSVTATGAHPIWVNNRGEWVDAEAVKAGDYLIDEDGVELVVEAVDVRQVSNQTVHNLTVDDIHTFFVMAGEDAVLTHNSGGKCPITGLPTTSAHPTFEPGPFAKKSIPARSADQTFTAAERRSIDALGEAHGCHTCGTTVPGTKSKHFVPDHQPVSSLNKAGLPQQLYPQCLSCSRDQGLAAARMKK